MTLFVRGSQQCHLPAGRQVRVLIFASPYFCVFASLRETKKFHEKPLMTLNEKKRSILIP